jgi:hypothetical protein
LWPGFTRWCFWKHSNHAMYVVFGVLGAAFLIGQGRSWEVLLGACSAFLFSSAFFALLVADGVLVEAIANRAGGWAGKWMETTIVVAHFAFQLFAIAAWATCVYWLFTVRRVGAGYAGGVLWAFFVVLRPVYYVGREDPLDDLPNQSAMMLCWGVFTVLLGAHAFWGFSVGDSLPLIATAAASTILCVCGILLGRPGIHGRSVSLCLGLGRLGISDPQTPTAVEFTPIADLLKNAKGMKQVMLEKRLKRAQIEKPGPSSSPQSEVNNPKSEAPSPQEAPKQ